ncbi:MAG: hypothetical protein JNK54_07585 [Elusimicrobia bacterium]|nr:hypothetical protein [Elusimicrobiota bacterium]
MKRSWRTLRLLLLTLPALSACGPVTFPADRLPEAVRALCLKEQKVEVEARLVGKTLALSCDLEGLIGLDLDFKKEALETLEGVMLSGTRASLSTDATVDFLFMRVRDSRLGSSITLLRYIPDIKGLIYMRYSRADFEDRLVIETDGEEDPETADALWHDITMPEFMARLISSRLHRQLTGNPLVSVFLRISRVRGRVEGGVLVLQLERAETEPLTDMTSEILESVVAEVTLATAKKYDPTGALLHTVRVEEKTGSLLWEKSLTNLSTGNK